MTNVKTARKTPIERAVADTAQTKVFDFSVPKIIGGALAAATAAFLGSRIGVAGTVFGAAIVSVITAVSGTLFTGSIHATRKRVTRLRGREDEAAEQSDVQPTAVVRVAAGRRLSPETLPEGLFVEDERPEVRPQTAPVRPPSGKRWAIGGAVAGVVVTALASFAVAMGLITGAEVTTGRSLDGKHGTTIGQVAQQAPSTAPTPTLTPSATATTTATATSTATPAATATVAPTGSASPTPTTSPSSTAQPTPTPTATGIPAPQG